MKQLHYWRAAIAVAVSALILGGLAASRSTAPVPTFLMYIVIAVVAYLAVITVLRASGRWR